MISRRLDVLRPFLAEDVDVRVAGDALTIRGAFDGRGIALEPANAALEALIEQMREPTHEQEGSSPRDPSLRLGDARSGLLDALHGAGLLRWSAVVGGDVWAVLESSPMVPSIACEAETPFVASRYAYVRMQEGRAVIGTALGDPRIVVRSPLAAAAFAALAAPRSATDLVKLGTLPDIEAARSWLGLLRAGLVAGPIDAAGACVIDREAAAHHWEFHDLLFHRRSRKWREGEPHGAKANPAANGPPPAVFPAPPARSAPAIVFSQREDGSMDAFLDVLRRRTSSRGGEREPLTVETLGILLGEALRIKRVVRSPLAKTDRTVKRPFPSGGGRGELQAYVVANRCPGLARAVYRYDARAHALHHVAAWHSRLDRYVRESAAYAKSPGGVQAVVILTARFARVAWKYHSIAYSLVLKNVGSAMATMCLVAEHANLSVRPIGIGDTSIIEALTGVHHLEESPVGELILEAPSAPLGGDQSLRLPTIAT